MPSNKKIQITDAGGTNLFPRNSLDNIQVSKTDNTDITLVTEIGATGSPAALPTERAVREALNEKQDTLIQGSNVSIRDNTVSVPDASSAEKGAVKINTSDSNGVSLEVDGGTVKVNAEKASTDGFGTVNVNTAASNGVSLEVNGGTVKVNAEKASVDGFGTVKVSTEDSNGVSLEVNGGTVKVNAAIATNDSTGVVAGAADGVTLDQGVVKANPGDGLLVEDGKVAIDDAPVKDVLAGLDTGVAINDEVVTPGNLTGALSLGQANDVSCGPYSTGTITYTEDDDFLKGFTCSLVNGTTVGYYDTGSHKFPKFAPGRTYLLIADVSGSGTITPNGGSAITLSGTPQRISIKITASNNGWISASTSGSMVVANWRQYAVSGMPDETVEFLASAVTNPNPDAMFRTTDLSGVLSRYLIKQNMVAPWMNVITMGDNANLTVSAGSNYKIKYTNDNPHIISVDTFPNNAYGWDAHIQMFIKGTSSIQFQYPLILMDALTPNAGHNLVVKFRNGDALVYVEDTNAGNIVISTTCSNPSVAGELQYFLQQDPGSGQESYIIFAPATDDLTCDAGTVSVAYNTDILGNGTDKTVITGTYDVASGKTMNLQDLTVSGSTFSGSGTTTVDNVAFNNVTTASGTVKAISLLVPQGSTVSDHGVLTAANGSTISGSGVIDLNSRTTPLANLRASNGGTNATLAGVTIQNGIGDGYGGVIRAENYATPTSVQVTSVTFANNGSSGSGNGGAFFGRYLGSSYFESCVFQNNSAFRGGAMYLTGSHAATLASCTFSGNSTTNSGPAVCVSDGARVHITGGCVFGQGDRFEAYGTGAVKQVTIAGSNTFDYVGRTNHSSTYLLDVSVADNAILDFSNNTYSYSILNGTQVTFGGDVTVIKPDGSTIGLDAITFESLQATGKLSGDLVINGPVTDPWKATNAIFASPLDAAEANTIKLTGTTFTETAKTLNTNRIQLPAATTVSFSGNTNATDTKILEAPVIVVGDDAAAPSGSATVVNAAGTASTVSGIGTYIDKEGDNDFVPLTSVTSVTSASGTGAGTLAGAFGDENRWAKLQNDLTATATFVADTTVVDNIVTAEYEPIIGGTYRINSGGTMTVDEATKTTFFSFRSPDFKSTVIPKGATVQLDHSNGNINMFCSGVSGGGILNCNGGNFGSAYEVNVSGMTITGCYNSTGGGVALINRAGSLIEACVISGNSAGARGGAFNIATDCPTTFKNCIITGNTGGYTNGPGGIAAYADTTISNCVLSGNISNPNRDLYIGGGTTTVIGGIIGNAILVGGSMTLSSNCCIDSITYYNSTSSGSVAIASGATLDLTGNTNATPINPGGGITFGANVTVINSAGSSVLLNGGEAGSCTKINNDGTIN